MPHQINVSVILENQFPTRKAPRSLITYKTLQIDTKNEIFIWVKVKFMTPNNQKIKLTMGGFKGV